MERVRMWVRRDDLSDATDIDMSEQKKYLQMAVIGPYYEPHYWVRLEKSKKPYKPSIMIDEVELDMFPSWIEKEVPGDGTKAL